MTAWLRREDEPAKPLTEDRKRLVQSYMDAEEETARREAIEERERQLHIREQAGPPAAKLHAVTPAETPPAEALPDETAEEAAIADAEERARREAGEEAARQIEAAQERARRWADQEVRRRVAVAVEGGREGGRRGLFEGVAPEAPSPERQGGGGAARGGARPGGSAR